MVQTLILTQGALAQELLRAAETINGSSPGVYALSLDWDDSLEAAVEKTRSRVEELADPDGLLILTDLFGGTPYNVAHRLADPGRIEVITGVNVPMVVRLCCRSRDEDSIESLAEWILGKARRGIQRDVVAGKENGR
jgi:PTS system mannose-specific IIA component